MVQYGKSCAEVASELREAKEGSGNISVFVVVVVLLFCGPMKWLCHSLY